MFGFNVYAYDRTNKQKTIGIKIPDIQEAIGKCQIASRQDKSICRFHIYDVDGFAVKINIPPN